MCLILNKFIFFFCVTLANFSIFMAKDKYLRPCYFTNWAQSRAGRAKYVPEDYIPGLCTHIFYAFANFDSNFSVTSTDSVDLPNEFDPKGFYARINALKEYDRQLKTVLSFGGWTFSTNTTLFQQMTKNSSSRQLFINSSIAFLRKYKFDGIDIDWEYPNSKQNFNLFLKELNEAFLTESQQKGTPRLLIAAAVSASAQTVNNSYDIPTVAKYVDFINLMSYDFHGIWESKTAMNSPLYRSANDSESEKLSNVAAAAYFWVDGGMPKSKVVIGMPTYGHGWTLTDPQNQKGIGAPGTAAKATEFVQEAGTGAYFEFCEMLAKGGAEWHFDEATKVPFLIYNGTQWFSYDDEKSIAQKVKWIRNNGFAGAYVWTLDFDDFNAKCTGTKKGRYPLIGTIARKLGRVRLSQKPVSSLIKATKSFSLF